ncbi:hypothetical protein C5F63_18575 [Photobacterium damselae subsp. damselae]|nr:hypothetical protein C5F63_18575 [Photobacterium damselae subsp. damselae]
MVFTEYRLINELVTVVMVRWVEEMGENWGLGKRRRRRKRRGIRDWGKEGREGREGREGKK